MSKKKLAGIIVVCTIVVISIVVPAIGEGVIDYSRLLSSLHYYGASTRECERIGSRNFRDTRGRRVEVNGSSMEVYEFNNATAMEAEASAVSADGSLLTRCNCHWTCMCWHEGFNWIGTPGTPHFYKGGRIIVIYIGDNSSTISLLVKALGEQFAGM
jgi:hypothetical protein